MGNTNIEGSWRLADEIFKKEFNNNSNSKKMLFSLVMDIQMLVEMKCLEEDI